MSNIKISEKNSIIRYYELCNNAYRDAWGLDKNMQLNLGLWNSKTRNLSEALNNLNELISKKAEINSSSIVLDAGCGVGGTAIFIAQKYNCKVVGISISEQQIEKARKNASFHGVEHLVEFKTMDYMQTTFKDSFFDVVLGIESICYAEPKINFIKEAKRVLKENGLLVLAENLQAKETLSKKEYQSLYTNAFQGCQVNSLDTKKQYLKNLEEAGFKTFECDDYTSMIKPSIKRLRRFYYLAVSYNFFHRIIGKRFSPIQEANTKMCYHLLSSLNQGLWSYGIIKAIK